MLRIGVLGAGGHSNSCHGPALKECLGARPGEVKLAAVCDIDRQRAEQYAQTFGFEKVYTEWREMLEREALDGLVAVTPINLTVKLVSELLPCGVPLLIEKPPGVTSGETRALRDLAYSTGTPHMVSFNRRFSPAFVRAQEWLAQHATRPPELVIARMLRMGRKEPDFVVGTAIHAIDTVLALLGWPTQVEPSGKGDSKDDRVYEAKVGFASGACARLLISPETTASEETYETRGGDWDIHVDFARCRVLIFDGLETGLFWQAHQDAPPALVDGSIGEMEAFLAALRGEREFTPDLEDGLAAMLVAEAIQQRRGVQIPL